MPGNTCVYVDVMLGRSCSSMLQNDLLITERERKSERRERERVGEDTKWGCSGETSRFTGLDRKEKEQEGKTGMDREKDR